MNIDNLLDLKADIAAYTVSGDKISGRIIKIMDNGTFVFAPNQKLKTIKGGMIKVSDGQDSVLSRLVEQTGEGLKLCVECFSFPGNEKRQDVRIYDKVYYSSKFLCHAADKKRVLPEAIQRLRSNKMIIDSFLKGKYGYPGIDEMPYTREPPFSQALWEINRKLDLLIHMFLAQDFKDLMGSTPKDVNISASGIRYITDQAFDMGDIIEFNLILPMVPLLFIRLIGEINRLKSVTSYGSNRYGVAMKFIYVDNDTKDDIIRYLFRRQREALRKRQDISS